MRATPSARSPRILPDSSSSCPTGHRGVRAGSWCRPGPTIGRVGSLDRLYQAQAKWTELADVLRRRAALARDPADIVATCWRAGRRADGDWLSSFEEAAAALRARSHLLPDHAALADQLVIALGRARHVIARRRRARGPHRQPVARGCEEPAR